MKKLYVGNLSYTTTEGSVLGLFKEFGPVESAQLIIDKQTGRSKGFAFVELASGDMAEKAIEALNGTELDGREIQVNEAKPQKPRTEGGGGGGGGRSGGYGGGGGGGGGYGGGGGGRGGRGNNR